MPDPQLPASETQPPHRTPAPTPPGPALPSPGIRTPAMFGLAATVVALLWAWQPSLWTDEAVTISAASRSWSSLAVMLGEVDAVHGAYYALMHLWCAVFGYSELALRLPSALAVGLSTAGLYALSYRLAGPRTAVAAAAVFAILPRTTWMGMEGRSFALSTALTVGLCWVLVAAVDNGRRRYFVLYALLAALGIAVNIYVLLVMAAHAVFVCLLPRARRILLPWLGAALAGVLAATPVLLAAVRQSGQLGTPDLSVGQLARNILVNQWFLGETPTNPAVPGSGSGLWQAAAVLLAGVAWLLAAFAVRRAPRPVPALALPLLLVPTAVLVLVSLTAAPIYNPRYLTLTAPAMALLIGAGLAKLRPGHAAVAGALLCVLILPVYASQRTAEAKNSSDWEQVADYVQTHAEPGNAVYFGPRRVPDGPLVQQTQRRISTAYPRSFDGLLDVTLLASGEEDGSLDGSSLPLQDSAGRLADVERVLAVRRADYPRELTELEDRWFAARGFTAVDQWAGTTNRVTVFARDGADSNGG